MSLTLSIKCIMAQAPFRNYVIKIYSQQLKIEVLVQNTFINKYEYYYQLWPCQSQGETNLIIELKQKIGEELKLKGRVLAKIRCTQQGERYKMQGGKGEDELILMKFKIEKERAQTRQAKQLELKKLNRQMQQNLQRYRKQIKGYQQFLHFTNNVVKELNQQPLKQKNKPQGSSFQEAKSENTKRKHNLSEYLDESSLSSNHMKANQHAHSNISESKPTSKLLINKQSRKIDTPKSQQRRFMASEQEKRQSQSFGSQIKGGKANEDINFPNKYTYLQDYQQPEVVKMQQSILINRPKLMEKIEEGERRNEKFIFVQKAIKKRQQQYLIIKNKIFQSKHQNTINHTLSVKIPPILSNHNQPQMHKEKEPSPSPKKEQQSKIDTSKAPSKQLMSQQRQKCINKQSYANQIQGISIITSNHNNSLSLSNKNQSSQGKSYFIKQQDKSQIKQRSQKSEKKEQQITRRKKAAVRQATLMSSQYNVQEINQGHSTIKSPIAGQQLVNKLTLFNIHTLFYANFKNNVKKCIIEHNNQIYQTQFQSNNLKETSWKNDRIPINSISPSEDIIFQIYSINNNQLTLQGQVILSIRQILLSNSKYYKFYLYYEEIAVGFIDFNVEKEIKENKRLSVSLPQIKSQPSKEIGSSISKTLRLTPINPITNLAQKQIAIIQVSNQSVEYSQPNSYITLSNNQITSKIRNLKLERKNRLK